jgi:cytochrome c
VPPSIAVLRARTHEKVLQSSCQAPENDHLCTVGLQDLQASSSGGKRNARAMSWSETEASRSSQKEITINRKIAQSLSLAAASVLMSAQALPQDNENEPNRDGELAYNSSCRTCHSIDEGDNRLGPNLHGIIGREAGSEEYGYSPAMSASDIVWDAKTLDRFIRDPQAVVPGNNMRPYGGISDTEIRANIVAYLTDARGDDDDEGE